MMPIILFFDLYSCRNLDGSDFSRLDAGSSGAFASGIINMNESLLAYVPMDRRHALARSEVLPERTSGSALFADVSGFTPLTEALVRELGPQRGAEELTGFLNEVYDALINELHRWGGSAIAFAGDAVTCWFDGDDTWGAHIQRWQGKAILAGTERVENFCALGHFAHLARFHVWQAALESTGDMGCDGRLTVIPTIKRISLNGGRRRESAGQHSHIGDSGCMGERDLIVGQRIH